MDRYRTAATRVRRTAVATVAATVLLTGLTAGLPITTTAVGAAPPGQPPTSAGRWGPVEDWPLIAIHAALDRDGRVVTYGTDGGGRQTGQFTYDRWTPGPSAGAGHEVLANTTVTDLFCSLQLNVPTTGDMVLFGGDNWTGTGTTNTGNADINVLDPDTGQLVPLAGMQRPRWYATGTTLPDGSIFVQGGDDGWDRPERWTPERGAELLGLDTSTYDWWYPKNFVLDDGRIFGVDILGRMYLVSADLTTITAVGQLPESRRSFGTTAVMYQPGKILHFGGSSASTVIIDVTGTLPVVTAGPPMSSPRRWVDSTLLPDGRVLATGGAAIEGMGTANDIGPYVANNSAEVWDPVSGRWTVQSNGALPRLYHSTALLLPDGRVLVAGGGSPGPVTNTNAEIFSPDYLVAAGGGLRTRPRIDAVSSEDLVPGQSLRINATSATGVDRVTMVKTGSVTHSFNMEQRIVELPFRTDGGSLIATVPANEAHVTPGWYLLSVLDPDGVPSTSTIVRVASPTADRAVTAVDGRIARLYQAYFLRQADDDGYRYWRRSLIGGLPLAVVSDSFATSAEFMNRYGDLSDAGFVDLIYGNVLGRAPDDGGRAYWLGQLAAGTTRGQVMMEFSESPEFIILTGTPAAGGTPVPGPLNPDPADPEPLSPPLSPPAAEIYRLYLGYFSRPPDDEGLAYWVAQRQAGASLAAVSDSFAASDEFRLRYGGTSDAQFVTLVYQHVMEREPDPDGLDYWVALLGAGLSRGQLMIQFSESPEFVARSGALF